MSQTNPIAEVKRSHLEFHSMRVIEKIREGESFTIPETITRTSPSGVTYPSTVSKGTVIMYSTDDPANDDLANFQPQDFEPGDKITVAVAANVLTITYTKRQSSVATDWIKVTGTNLTKAQVILHYYPGA